MLGEVVAAVTIIKTVVDIWRRVKSQPTAESAQQVAHMVEQRGSTQNVTEVVRTLKVQANQNLSATDAGRLVSDVKYRWVLEPLRIDLETNRRWDTLLEPEFLLVMERITTMGQLITDRHIMGFVSGPKTAQAIDVEFERWGKWLASRSGHPQGLLVYIYDHLTNISADHVVGKKKRKAIGGYLDLSRMKLEPHKGVLDRHNERFGGLTPWESETRDALRKLHEHYLRISGFFE